MDDDLKTQARRPLATRDTKFAKALVDALLKTSVTPNQISLASIGVAAFGALCLYAADGAPWLYVLAAISIQLRLLCNLLDGMVAVEGGRGTPTGGLFNEIPDRIADSLFIVAAGYAAGLPAVGWLAALLAAITAYIRVLGGALGLEQDFSGLFAKQRRMALLTGVCVLAAFEAAMSGGRWALMLGVVILAAGALHTCVTRTLAIAQKLETRG